MHHADPSRSVRLARALNYIKSAGPVGVTTQELQLFTGSMAPATDCSELRQTGHQIECKMDEIRNGRRIYRYKYTGRTPPNDQNSEASRTSQEPETSRLRDGGRV